MVVPGGISKGASPGAMVEPGCCRQEYATVRIARRVGVQVEADRRLKDIVVRYQKTAPQLAAWLEHAAPGATTVLMIPTAHRRRLRTTNGLERLNKEIKRRTRVATLFPNEASLLRLSSTVLSEISDDWETERAYLNMEAR